MMWIYPTKEKLLLVWDLDGLIPLWNQLLLVWD